MLQVFGISWFGIGLGALSEENFGEVNVSQVGSHWGVVVSTVSVGAQIVVQSLALRGD